MNTDRASREDEFDPLLFSRLIKSGHKKMRSMSSPLLMSKIEKVRIIYLTRIIRNLLDQRTIVPKRK